MTGDFNEDSRVTADHIYYFEELSKVGPERVTTIQRGLWSGRLCVVETALVERLAGSGAELDQALCEARDFMADGVEPMQSDRKRWYAMVENWRAALAAAKAAGFWKVH